MGLPKRMLTRAQASQLWERAARLQQEHREAADAGGHGELITVESVDSVEYDLALRSAVETGIDAVHVERAAAELRLETFLDPGSPGTNPATALGVTEARVREHVHIRAEPATVREAVARLMASEAFRSDPVEIVEVDEHSTALVYEVPSLLRSALLEDSSSGSFHYAVRGAAEIRRFAVVVSSRDTGGSEIAVHATLGRSMRVNAIALRVFQAIVAPVAAGLGALGLSVLISALPIAATAGTLLVGIGAAASGIAAYTATGNLYRRAYRRAYERAKESFRRLLTAIRMQLGS